MAHIKPPATGGPLGKRNRLYADSLLVAGDRSRFAFKSWRTLKPPPIMNLRERLKKQKIKTKLWAQGKSWKEETWEEKYLKDLNHKHRKSYGGYKNNIW